MKILLVDDHAIVRDGVHRLLAAQMDCVILEAPDAESALRVHDAERPDIILLDLNLAGVGGLEILQRLSRQVDAAPVVVLSMHSEAVYVTQALKAGARGYVSKAAPPEEVLAAVKTVLAGGRYIERELVQRMATLGGAPADPLDQLTLREIEILRLLGRGESLTSIAGVLGVAYKTVANTCTQMKIKLGLERTADLIRVALGSRNMINK